MLCSRSALSITSIVDWTELLTSIVTTSRLMHLACPSYFAAFADHSRAPENRDLQPVRSAKYMICGTDGAQERTEGCAGVSGITYSNGYSIRSEQISTGVEIAEITHRCPVVLPVGPRNTNLKVEAGSIRCTASIARILQMIGQGGTMLRMIGSPRRFKKPETGILHLKPGGGIPCRGVIRVRELVRGRARCRTLYQPDHIRDWFSGKADGV